MRGLRDPPHAIDAGCILVCTSSSHSFPHKPKSVFQELCNKMTRYFPSIVTRPFRALCQSPWVPPSVIPPRIDTSLLVEEEKSPFYETSYFYPARIGEVLNGRYQIATKLGHGSRSNVWLARDLHQFVLYPSSYEIHIHNSDGVG